MQKIVFNATASISSFNLQFVFCDLQDAIQTFDELADALN